MTKLDRDPSSGTALQEISFWLNLERALLRIQEKRESSEVALTLDVLKHGKRFHATVSFDTDTGLKQAIATVNDYNPLMKDFPINDLLSATELDRIRTSVQAIFSHLRKIRNTKYPIQRALRLVEAISRDVVVQMLKVSMGLVDWHKLEFWTNTKFLRGQPLTMMTRFWPFSTTYPPQLKLTFVKEFFYYQEKIWTKCHLDLPTYSCQRSM